MAACCLRTISDAGAYGSGTGFFVAVQCLGERPAGVAVFTAAHVVEGTSRVWISMHGNVVELVTIATRKYTDTAVLAFKDPENARRHLEPRPLEIAMLPDISHRVRVIGFPNGESETKSTPGCITSVLRSSSQAIPMLVTDITAKPGCSGGPVVDHETNQVVGMLVAASVAEAGLSELLVVPSWLFAMPFCSSTTSAARARPEESIRVVKSADAFQGPIAAAIHAELPSLGIHVVPHRHPSETTPQALSKLHSIDIPNGLAIASSNGSVVPAEQDSTPRYLVEVQATWFGESILLKVHPDSNCSIPPGSQLSNMLRGATDIGIRPLVAMLSMASSICLRIVSLSGRPADGADEAVCFSCVGVDISTQTICVDELPRAPRVPPGESVVVGPATFRVYNPVLDRFPSSAGVVLERLSDAARYPQLGQLPALVRSINGASVKTLSDVPRASASGYLEISTHGGRGPALVPISAVEPPSRSGP